MLDDWMKRNGIDARSFHGAMLVAMCKADLGNQARIRSAFPKVGEDYDLFMIGAKYGMNLSRISKEDLEEL